MISGACSERAPSHEPLPHFDPKELEPFALAYGKPVTMDGATVPAPSGGPLRPGEEIALQGTPGNGQGTDAPGRRSMTFRPDRITDLEGRLGYYEVFSPAIAPFKRMTALDAVTRVDGVPVLGVAHPERTAVPIEGLDRPPPDDRPRDRFWGSVVLDFGASNVLPLPSVSPESRLLALSSEPTTDLAIERDGADNFYVVARQKPDGEVRLTFVTDAPRSYFGAALPSGTKRALSGEVFPLPPAVERDARLLTRELGLAELEDDAAVLRALVQHFRSFEESKIPPADSGNILLDLARARRGVCRHRAYAFMILAQSLGIPARFVQNEAHAWVEVKLPELGFMRIDLGGAAEGLDARSLQSRPQYRPESADPWPRPPAYEDAYARAALDAERQRKKLGGASGRGGQARVPGDTRLLPTLALGQGDGALSAINDDRALLTLRVTRYVPEVMRGNVLEVEGVAEDEAERPVPGLRVELSLAEPVGEHAVLLGVAVTDREGRFRGSFSVPPDLEPAEYALVVVTPGDAQHRAARAP